MDSHLPVSVRFGAHPPGIVVDATFALSPMGLLVTMALSRSANVWLPRGLYTLLDNDAHYRHRPEQMGGLWLPPETRAVFLDEIATELEPWRRAWQNGRLSSRVHWVGDAQYESALPTREESGLLPRFESCCAALDARLGNLSALAAPLDECARDVVALSAALQPDITYIITAASEGRGAPPLCDHLERLGFAIRQHASGAPDAADAAFEIALAPLAASGRDAAILQIVAPVILAMPDSWHDNDWSLEDTSDAGAEASDDPWRNACVLWRPLAARAEVVA
jgi:hypothetical protein